MITLEHRGVYYINNRDIVVDDGDGGAAGRGLPDRAGAARGTIASRILDAHNTSGDSAQLKLKFDALASHDITYVGIIQTARASGLERFPMPYVLTNCHNSLCAVGGTINEDDHVFGLSAAVKYGGIFVPAHLAVIHMYMRERMAKSGGMILGSDSHTRYGALGCLAIGEGGGELAKQLLGKTYDTERPPVVAVWLDGEPQPGVGPQDVALALVGAVFEGGFAKNKILEFIGPGVSKLPVEYRQGIDVMTTETACLSSVWRTDEQVREYLAAHGREEDYEKLEPEPVAYYDGMIKIDLSRVECMIAMPFHPSNALPIRELLEHPEETLIEVEEKANRQIADSNGPRLDLRSKLEHGRLRVDQGVIAGCAGGIFDNVAAAADVLRGGGLDAGEFALSVYPGSQPVALALNRDGITAELISAGVMFKTAFCGPCFGADGVPANGALSIRHTTRNFPNREGSKPKDGQLAAVALMDARSIAATARNGGLLTAATELDVQYTQPTYTYESMMYDRRVYCGSGRPDPAAELKFGPNITDWPTMPRLTGDMMMRVVSVITDPVTTTDELIPSGETSSYRSNPRRLAQFTLSRKDPGYVGRAEAAQKVEVFRESGGTLDSYSGEDAAQLTALYRTASECAGRPVEFAQTDFGSAIFANHPGDGSAREQAASCQRVLGGFANVAVEYATKRYRSNLINWGLLPFVCEPADAARFKVGACLFVPDVLEKLRGGVDEFAAYLIDADGLNAERITLRLASLTPEEREILAAGCLINYYKK